MLCDEVWIAVVVSAVSSDDVGSRMKFDLWGKTEYLINGLVEVFDSMNRSGSHQPLSGGVCVKKNGSIRSYMCFSKFSNAGTWLKRRIAYAGLQYANRTFNTFLNWFQISLNLPDPHLEILPDKWVTSSHEMSSILAMCDDLTEFWRGMNKIILEIQTIDSCCYRNWHISLII